MKRILRLSTLAGVVAAAVLLASLAPVAPHDAHAGPLYRAANGGYYSGGYGPGYGAYSGYGFGPYGYSSSYGYANPMPGGYVVAPSYRAYGFGNGFGTGATYTGTFNRSPSGTLPSGQANRPPYKPYGYGPYGSTHHVYGYY